MGARARSGRSASRACSWKARAKRSRRYRLTSISTRRGRAQRATEDRHFVRFEAGTLTNYNAYIWETLPVSATVAQHAASFDFDGDGEINGDEFIAFTSADSPSSVLRILRIVRNGSQVELTYTTVVGRNYNLESTGDLMTPWIPIPGTVPGTGSPITTSLGPVTGFDEIFYRVHAGP